MCLDVKKKKKRTGKKKKDKKVVAQDPEIDKERFCDQLFPELTKIRRTIREILKQANAWPLPDDFVSRNCLRCDNSICERKRACFSSHGQIWQPRHM
jgi:hypothetical protein